MPEHRRTRRGAPRRMLVVASFGSLLAACSSGGHRPPPPPPPTSTSTTSSTLPSVQTTGARTVLSPIGLNVRAQPDQVSKVIGSAAQGTVLTVLGHTDAGGGWFQVKGATVTGWISADPSLSARGRFRTYQSGHFNALYPDTWTWSPSPPASVLFRSTTGPDTIVVSVAAATSKLPHGRDGYGRSGSTQVVVCGVTSDLVTYQRAAGTATTAPGPSASASVPYLAEVRLTLDPQHALGVYGSLSGLGPHLEVYEQFLASISFAFPQCMG